MHGSIELDAEEGCDKVQASSCSKHTPLDFEEPRACAYLDIGSGDAEKMDGWYLDSGATHHMTGCRELFTKVGTFVWDQ